MKKIGLYLFVAAAVMMLGSCRVVTEEDLGKKLKKEITVKPFEEIFVQGGVEVKFTQGDSVSVVVEAPEKIWDEVSVVSDGKTLSVIPRDEKKRDENKIVWDWGSSSFVTVYVTAPTLTNVTVLGSGDCTVNGLLETDSFTAQLSGSGDVKVSQVKCRKAELGVMGSGDMEVGMLEAGSCEVGVVGSGDLKTKLHGTAETGVTVTGSGDAKVTFVDCGHVKAQVTGSGDIELTGNVQKLDKSVTGSGDIDVSRLKTEGGNSAH